MKNSAFALIGCLVFLSFAGHAHEFSRTASGEAWTKALSERDEIYVPLPLLLPLAPIEPWPDGADELLTDVKLTREHEGVQSQIKFALKELDWTDQQWQAFFKERCGCEIPLDTLAQWRRESSLKPQGPNR